MDVRGLDTLLAVALVAALAPVVVAALPGPRIPQIVVLILAGVLIGPHGLGLADTGSIELLSDIGLGFLFLLAGYELDPKLFREQAGQLAMIAWAASALLSVAAVAVLAAMNYVRDFVPIGLALTTTALGTLLPILRDNNLLSGKFGRYALAAGAVGELFPIVAISVFLTNRQQFVAIGSLAAVTVAALLLTAAPRILGERKLAALIKQGQRATAQSTLRWAIVLLLALLVLAQRFGLDVVLGAMLAGLVLRRWTGKMGVEVKPLEDKLAAVGYGFFIPLFFVASGMTLDIHAIIADPIRLLVFAGLLLVVRGLPSLLIYLKVLPFRQRLEMTFITATTMPLLIALAEIGLHDGVMLPSNAAALVGAGVLSVLIFPAVAAALNRQARRREPGEPALDARAVPEHGTAGDGMVEADAGQPDGSATLEPLPAQDVALDPGGDEVGERAERVQRIQVEVFSGDVHAETPLHLAQQQRAGQRIQADPGPEQWRPGWHVGQFRAPGRLHEHRPQLACDCIRPVCRHRTVTQSGRSGSSPASGRAKTARPSGATAPASARSPAAASAMRIGTLRSVTRHGTRSSAAPSAAADRHSQASRASSAPRPSARHDIITSGAVTTSNRAGTRTCSPPLLPFPVKIAAPTSPSSPKSSASRTVVTVWPAEPRARASSACVTGSPAELS
jgi:Kef-type K+ transport system membrane component KefB